jgi:hypothetical protein
MDVNSCVGDEKKSVVSAMVVAKFARISELYRFMFTIKAHSVYHVITMGQSQGATTSAKLHRDMSQRRYRFSKRT